MKIKWFLAFILMNALLAGCKQEDSQSSSGGDTSPAVPETLPPAMSVSSVASLPSCDDFHKNYLYFIEADGAFKVCKSNGWSSISIVGPQGASGSNGAQGQQGVQGPTGPQGSAGESGLSRFITVDQLGVSVGIQNSSWTGQPFSITGTTQISVSYRKVSGTCSVCTGTQNAGCFYGHMALEVSPSDSGDNWTAIPVGSTHTDQITGSLQNYEFSVSLMRRARIRFSSFVQPSTCVGDFWINAQEL